MHAMPQYTLIPEKTEALVDWAAATRAEAATPFEAAREIARRLGAHYREGHAEVGFWAPHLTNPNNPAQRIALELLTPLDPIDLQAPKQKARFQRTRLPLVQDGEYCWGVIAGMQPGHRDQLGAFYWLAYQDKHDVWHNLPDPLAASVPFGTQAPAEFYDIEHMQQARADREHFAHLDTRPDPDGVPRITGPTNILQIHVGTASPEGTLAGLTRIYQEIGQKMTAGEPLTAAEQNYIAYDAIQLMPIEPTIEYEAGPAFWQPLENDPQAQDEAFTVALRSPDMTNWGYDIMTVASPAPNPAVMDSQRPDELVDLIAALHNFPGQPIMMIFDIVYGHADNQSLPLLPPQFFTGPNMYGQDLNFRHPVVRAMLLEMQRRKSNYGVDGIRVDGAQDFKYWDAEAQVLRHDDDYLTLMNDIEQEVAGQRYRPWMIFEDGRPWPREDWELASTYHEVTDQHPNVVQWGPLTFAHNTPFLFTFWISKWWRIREITRIGSDWITGCANHDTLRRGTQVDPEARINTYLGDTLPDIFKKAYDNPAAKLFDYAYMPGIPMDFINASMRAPWGFIRNTDDRYGVKVVSEEAHFLDWIMNEALFAQDHVFKRLKAMGFVHLDGLRRFMRALDHTVQITPYDLPAMAKLLQNVEPPLDGPTFTVPALKEIARAWMDDVDEICNVSHYREAVSARTSDFNRAVREFRRARPWLINNLRPDEHFDHQRPVNGTVLFYGLRRAPEPQDEEAPREEVLFIANMEGAPRTLTPLELPIPDLPREGWEIAFTSPDIDAAEIAPDRPITLHDSQGVVFTRK
ncbi:MAG: glucosylglycerol hydrolase [Anaerolineales bacterium]